MRSCLKKKKDTKLKVEVSLSLRLKTKSNIDRFISLNLYRYTNTSPPVCQITIGLKVPSLRLFYGL